MFRFQQTRLQIQKELGKGRFGKVYPYQKHPEDLKWAVKRIKAGDADALVASLPEIVLGSACDHPNIVPVKGYFIEKNPDNEGYNIYMKLPRMKESLMSDFKERKRTNTPYSEEEIIRHFYSLVCGVGYFHSKKIYHGDLRPENLLLDNQGVLNIGDIGIAKHMEGLYQTLPHYSAPEILGEKLTKENLPKADIWSIGAVVLELCVFDFKILNSSSQDKLQNKLDELFKNLEGKYRDSLKTLLKTILNLNPKERPDIAEIKATIEKDFSQIIDTEKISAQNTVPEHAMKKITPYAYFSQALEVESSQLKAIIAQLERDLAVQRQREDSDKDRILKFEQELVELRVNYQKQTQITEIAKTKLRTFEVEIEKLSKEKTSSEQRNKELERYIETTVKQQMEAYEEKIKVLQKYQLEGNPSSKSEALPDKLKESDAPKEVVFRESFGEEYNKNLDKVVKKLKDKWIDDLKIKIEGKILQITMLDSFRHYLTDQNLKEISNDMMKALGANKLHNLFGLELNFTRCFKLTDQAFEDFAKAISSQPLHLESLSLNFKSSNLTDQALKELKKVISAQIRNLHLDFSGNQKIKNSGVHDLADTIKKTCKNLQEFTLNLDGTAVSNDFRRELIKEFAYVPKLDIYLEEEPLSDEALHYMKLYN